MAFLGLLARFGCARRSAPRTSPARRQARPGLEGLEDRVVPYAVSGNAWPNPQLVTISFVPDGTNLGGVASNFQAALNTDVGAGNWLRAFQHAFAEWETYANVNFSQVGDDGAPTIAAGSFADEE